MQTQSVDEHARRAVAEAKKRLPRWQSLARVIARNPKLEVKLGPQSSTDGKTIWIKVPYEMGLDLPHDRLACGTRDDDMVLYCPACRLSETMETIVIHEVSHIVNETFLNLRSADLRRVVDSVIRNELERDPASKFAAKMEAAMQNTASKKSDYYTVVASAHPFLQLLMNTAEDARVNAATQRSRPGTVNMFTALYYSTFRQGLTKDDGSVSRYDETPANFQMAMAILLSVSEYQCLNALSEKVQIDVQDPELQSIILQLRNAQTVKDVYRLVLPLLTECQRLGYFLMPDDVEEDAEDGDSSDDSSEDSGSGDPNPSDDSGVDGDDSGGESADDPGTDEGGESTPVPDYGTPEEVMKLFKIASGHGDDLDEHGERYDGKPTRVTLDEKAWNDAVSRAATQVDFFDGPSLHVRGVEVVRPGSGEMGWAEPTWGMAKVSQEPITIPESVLLPALNKLRLVFTNNQRRKSEHNLKSGKVDTRTLGRRAPVGDPRVFKKKVLPGRKDYFVVIGMDVSGSTSSGAITILKEAAMAKAELLHRLNVPFALYAHSGDTHPDANSEYRVAIMEVKSPKDPWSNVQRRALEALVPYAGNLDGHTLEFYRKVAQRSDATDRIILYYTDGEMPASNYQEELEVLQREIKVCGKLGISLVGVGVGTDSPSAHGLDTIRLDGVSDVPKVVTELKKRLGG